MQWIRANLPITLAFALSVALHLLVVFPALGVFGGPGGPEEGLDSARPVKRGLDGTDEKGAAKDASREKAAERSAENSRRALQERRDRVRNLPPELRDREKRFVSASTRAPRSR